MPKLKELFGQYFSAKMLLNRYVLTILAFAIWMVFFDKYKVSNNLYLGRTISKLEKSKEELKDNIKSAHLEKKDLEENSEKFAREKFYMHKDNEEVFIIDK